MKKKCTKCKIEKDVRCFYKTKKQKSGYECWCIQCEKERYRNRKAKDPEAHNLKRKLWARKQKEKDPEFFKKKYQREKDRILAYIKSNKERDKVKLRARNNVNRWLRLGKIIKPKECSKCFNETKIEAHHEDYTKPKEITWLCVPCHVVADKERRNREKLRCLI